MYSRLLSVTYYNHRIHLGGRMDLIENGKKVIYVSQDNYYLVNPIEASTIYYCDSATSCIIIIATGYSSVHNSEIALISHLSRPGRFDDYFSIIEKNFDSSDMVKFFAAGANPPERYKKASGGYDTTALNNATQLISWLAAKHITLDQVSLRLGQGDPAIYDNDLDCYSISFDEQKAMTVTNRRIYITQEQRDPDQGLQTLFCIYGDPNFVRNQTDTFTEKEISVLVNAARNAGLEEAAKMSDKEILNKYSSTPEYEVPWFCDSIRQAANYVINYSL